MAPRWTEKEDDLMREFYPDEGTEMAVRLAGRTKEAIWQHAMKLGLNVTPETLSRNISMHHTTGWTDEEKQKLEAEYKENMGRLHELVPRHTERACKVRLSKKGLTEGAPSPRWTDEELAIIRDNLDKTASKIKHLLPRHTVDAIGVMRCRIKKERK